MPIEDRDKELMGSKTPVTNGSKSKAVLSLKPAEVQENVQHCNSSNHDSIPEIPEKLSRKSSKEQLTSPVSTSRHSTPKTERKKQHKPKSKKKNSRDSDAFSLSPILSHEDEKNDGASMASPLTEKAKLKPGLSKKKSKLNKPKNRDEETTGDENKLGPKKEKGIILRDGCQSLPSKNGASTHQAEDMPAKNKVRDSFLNKDINLTSYLSMKEFSNSVDVIVNDKKFICSGVILAYHSPVFEYQLAQGARMITLDELKCPVGNEGKVEECLLLLYGAGVIITDANIGIVIRFSVLFKIENMYRLALEWVRNCISVSNVYSLWSLGHESIILQKVKRKKNDLIYNCKNFVKGNEVEIAYELQKLRKSGLEINENFLMLLLRNTNCTSIITDLL